MSADFTAVTDTPPAIAPSAAYRNGQAYLFNSIAAASEASRVSGGTDLSLDNVGPMRSYVDSLGWAWDNTGGDWIDSTSTRQGTTPWASMSTPAAGSAATYTADVTTALQLVRSAERWNAWIVSRASGGTVRTTAMRFHATTAYRPRIDVTYTDATTATLACRVSAFLGSGSSIPTQAADTYNMSTTSGTGELALEFDLPTKDVSSATMYFTVLDHWGGSCTLNFNLADPPLNTDPVTYGIAEAFPLDQGLTLHPSAIFAHRYNDGTTLADYSYTGAAIDSESAAAWDPALVGGSSDPTKLPHVCENVWLGGWEAGGASVVDSTYTGEGFEALAPGVGALKVLMDKHAGIADGVEGGQNGTAAANSHIYLSYDRSGLQRHIFTRYYMRIGSRHAAAPYRFDIADKFHVLKAGVPTWTDNAGKCSINAAHKTQRGGNSGSAGSGYGWTLRDEFADYHHSTDSPSAGGWSRSISWYDYQNNPSGHNYGNTTDLPAGVTLSKSFHGLAQRQALGASLYADRWYCIEQEIYLNSVDVESSPGSGEYWTPDGEVRIWVDGRLAYEQDGLVMRSLPIVSPIAGKQPGVREMGVSTLWFNWFHGGLTRNTIDRVVFIAGLVAADERIGPMQIPSGAPASGTITNVGATNTIASLDPASDPLANPNYPAAPPWEVSGSGTWSSMLDYGGAVFVPYLGTQGTYLMWASAGHSAVGACMWVGYDVAENLFKRVGPRPLPTTNLAGYTAGTVPSSAAFDHTWGDWDGDWVGWPSGFAQAGIIVPEGGHTRNSMAYRPGHKAGNSAGEVFKSWHATGVNSSTGIASAHVWDADAETWARAGAVAPEAGSAVGALVYHEAVDYFVAPHKTFSATASYIDIADGPTKTWVRRSMTSGGRVHEQDNTAFAWVDAAGVSWHVIVWNYLVTNSPPLQMFAVSVDALIANTSPSWVDLTLSATTYPVNGSGVTSTVSWVRCPINGAYYAVNRVASSNKLWKLAPPGSGVLTDTWTITEQTLTGSLQSSDFDYSRLQWCPAKSTFLWRGPGVSNDMQFIRPTDI